MLARINTSEAIISCSPPRSPVAPCPVQGNAGDRIQISRGTLAMRLNVMELGKFMWVPTRQKCLRRDAGHTHSPTPQPTRPNYLKNGHYPHPLKHVRNRTLSKEVHFGSGCGFG